jgi:predicted NBD/HSP70 family sugar kinase
MALAETLPRERLLGVGIAVRGLTDAAGRSSLSSMGALCAGEQPLAEWVERETGLPAYLMNNVRAMLAAQLFLTREANVRGQYFLRCEYGIGAATVAPDVITGLVKNPAITAAVDDFRRDFEELTEPGKTMYNL